jgi:signal peptidase II
MHKILAYLLPRQHALMWAALVLLADDISKEWALWALQSGVLPMWLLADERLGYIGFGFGWNRGMSFSALDGFAYAPQFLGLVAVLAAGWFTHWLTEKPWPSFHQAGLALIIGGALGNLVDRVQHGAVVDFLVLNPWGLFPYTFNIADVAITFGVLLLLLDMWREHR